MNKLATSLVLLCAVGPFTTVRAADAPAGATPPASVRVSDLFTNSIVAKGEGVSVTRSQLDEALIGIKTRAAAQGQPIPPAMLTTVERQILERLVQVKILNTKATEAEKTAGRELAAKRADDLKERAGSDAAFDLHLKSVGLTKEQLLDRMAEEVIAETVLKRELKIEVTEDEIKKFYEENPAEFEQPELARAAHVLFMTIDPATRTDLPEEKKAEKKKAAEDLLKKARAGDDFAALAKQYSEDDGSKNNGGEYVFSRAEMVPAFSAAAFSLGTNQVSEVVTTQYGYHIIKLYEKSPARKAALKDDVVFMPPPKRYLVVKDHWIGEPDAMVGATNLTSLIRMTLENQELQKQIPEYLAKLQKDANVEILDERLKPEPEMSSTNSPAGN
jgi:parvulin-like peptidyl-prolyl isomerase